MKTIQKLFAFTSIAVLFLGITGFDKLQQSPKEEPYFVQQKIQQDTVPTKFEIDLNLNKIVKELTDALQDVKIEIKKLDWEKLQRDINNTLKDLNLDKTFAEIEKAIKEIDAKKLALDLKTDLKTADLDEVKREMEKAFNELNKTDFKKLKIELKNLKIEIDPKQKEALRKNIQKLKPEVEQKMQELKKEMEKLKQEIKKSKSNNYTNINDLQFEYKSFIVSSII